jgi:rubrerythrin
MDTHEEKMEIAKKLIAELEEELEGIIKYDCLFNELGSKGMVKEAVVIQSIASEEYWHAMKIWRLLDQFEIEMPEKIETLWDKVSDIFD